MIEVPRNLILSKFCAPGFDLNLVNVPVGHIWKFDLEKNKNWSEI